MDRFREWRIRFLDWPFPEKPGRLWKILSAIGMTATHAYGKVWMTKLNRTRVINKDLLNKYILNQPENMPLITVSNHTSCMDDPHFLGMLPSLAFRPPRKGLQIRWVPGAKELVFTQIRHALFFSLGQIVPVVRGYGVYQRAMNFVVDRLNEGGWAHIYAEGQVNESDQLMRLKWGVGRLISDCFIPPIVLPIWHVGMDDVLPNTSPYFPRICKRVTILVEDPLDFTDMLSRQRKTQADAMTCRKEITDAIERTFAKMRQKAIELHQEHCSEDKG
eukprot:m.309499 g.309499  ORF g.309499 m.309499 type:complete len:275 (+) comp46684_c0_seq1:26-850(+)